MFCVIGGCAFVGVAQVTLQSCLINLYKNMYTSEKSPKPVVFLGTSLADLRAFPQEVKREAGYQVDQVQHGGEPDDCKPMSTIGPGVREIRVRDAIGAFRVIYVAKLSDAIYILHCFQKKTQRTSSTDLALAAQRFRE